MKVKISKYNYNKCVDFANKQLKTSADLYAYRGEAKKDKIVLMYMLYNLGLPTLKKFKKTLGYIKDGDWKDASLEMLDSRWARQVGNRATNLSKLMASIDD